MIAILLVYLAIGVVITLYVACCYPIVFHAGWHIIPLFIFAVIAWPRVLCIALKG